MKKIWKIYLKYAEIIKYIFWGVMTTLVNYSTYFLCTRFWHIHYLPSNVIAWTVGVIFAFYVNKIFVFDSKGWEPNRVFQELWKFVSGRIFSGLLETTLLLIFVDYLHFEDSVIKIFAGILVVIVNYIVSKWLVFKNK